MVEKLDMEAALGGRLPLQLSDGLSDAQRALYDRLTRRRSEAEPAFRNATDDGRLIGPFNAMLHSPKLGGAFLDLHEVEEKYTSLSRRVREVVIMAVGATWKSDYELYAHSALSHRVGFAPDVVDKMLQCMEEPGLHGEEQSAWAFARELSMTRQVSDETYARAERDFGLEGLVAITFLVGAYHITSLLLNAFDVPAPV